MGITFSDLIVESVIRDGIAYLKANPDVVDDVFSELTKVYASQKYGASEIAKIKAMLASKNIAVVHSFHEAAAKSPCYSIQLGAESEAKERAHLNDHEMEVQEAIEDEEELVRVDLFVPDGYDPLTGKVSVPDDVDLSACFPKFIFVDADDEEFEIQSGISNEDGDKFFFIPKQAEVNVAGQCFVKTFLDVTQHEEKGDTSAVNLLIGVHAKDALTAKYLYVILKYIFKSRKTSLIRRGIVNSSFSGSDFTRDLKYEGDVVFTRFFTLSGQVDDTWRSDETILIDSVEVEGTPVE